jgi:DnaK suppressor protein
VTKTTAKSATSLKAAAPKKPPPKAAVSAKAPAKSAAATSAPVKATAKPALKAGTPKPAPAPVAKAAPAKAAPAPAAPAAKASSGRKSSGPKTMAPIPTVDPAAVAASRFADRFAPPKHTVRPYPDSAMDTLKPAVKADPKLANAWKSKPGRELTEAELLAMPEGEYMNDKQLDFFRARLTALKDDLLSNAGETTEHLREDTSIVPDPADRATIEEEHALELRTRDRERKLLKKISQSLARIEAGDYGFCDETGEPIGLGRLLARPTATLSLEAQQRRELKQKMFGD